nr:vegetative cell wall protein gp1-like [Macaca fascicularis]
MAARPVHLLPAPPEDTETRRPLRSVVLIGFVPPASANFTAALSDPLLRSVGLSSRLPSGRVAAVPAPGNRPPACPGRAPLAALLPSIPASRRIWQAHRSTARRTGGRGPAGRAPPLHAQSRTSPPCEPSPGCAFLPGKEKKVPARPPPLKGAAPPLPPHPPYPSSAFSPKHLSATPKGLDFPSPPLASLGKGRLGSKMDVTGGAGGGICPAAFLPLLLLLKRPARWRDLALAHLGTDFRARLAGMLDSPPQRCDRNNVQTVGSAGGSRKLPGGGVSGQRGKKGAAEERQKNWVLVQVKFSQLEQ